MIYVLLMIVSGGGGLSAEFSNQDACEAARAAFLEASQNQSSISICVPKG